METAGAKKTLLGLIILISALVVFGLLWAFVVGDVATRSGFGWYLFSYAMGLTMIVLPCTLPLAFVIVPLAMGKGPVKGLGMAIMFGLGVTLTLSAYGIVAAMVGKVAIGTLDAPLETVKNWVYFVAGIFAYLFALGEVGLVKYRMPTYTGAIPGFIQKQSDYLKALMLGLFLGNIGVGCPHPATPLILTEIASSGDIFYGWSLFFVHAVGRVLPLILIALLGILGVNALSWVLRHKDRLERTTGWLMVFVAGFILVLGLFTHDWWVNSGIHTLLEEVTQEERFLGALSQRFGGGLPHSHGLEEGTGLLGLPLGLGNWALVLLWLAPLWWYYKKQNQSMLTMSDEDKKIAARVKPWRFWFSVVFSILVILLFTYVLPNRFSQQVTAHVTVDDHHDMMDEEMMGHDMMGEHDTHGASLYHEESTVTAGLAVGLKVEPTTPTVTEPTTLRFTVEERPGPTPVSFDKLELAHEKLMHVIGVSADLENFLHVHPVPTSNSGELVTSHQFVTPGNYKLWSEVSVAGLTHTFGYPSLSVSGAEDEVPPAAEPRIDFGRNVIAGDYQIALVAGEPVVAEQPYRFSFDIHDLVGNEVILENYLGVPMHLAIIKSDLSTLIHTHPLEGDGHSDGDDHTHGQRLIPEVLAHGGASDPSVPEQGLVSFETVFPSAGFYKLFAQFRPQGSELPADEALVGSFWLEVVEGTGQPIAITSSQPPSRTTLVIISLALILVLGWGVSRFVSH